MGGYGPAIASGMIQHADQIGAEKRQHAQALSDEEFQTKLGEIKQGIGNLQQKISNLDPNSPDYQQAKEALAAAIQSRNDMFHPAKNPGALAKFGHLLHIGKQPQAQSVTTPNAPLALPPSTSAPIENEAQVGLDAASLPGITSPGPVLPAAAPVTVKGPAETPQQLKAQAQSNMAAQKEASQIAAGAPMSSVEQVKAKIAKIDASPLSTEDKAEAKRKLFGITDKPTLKLYTLSDGTKAWLDASRPELIPQGATASGGETIAAQEIEAYNKDVNEHGYKGSIDQWKAEQRRKGSPSTSAINEGREDYAKSHGFESYDVIPDQYRDVVMNYIIRKQAMDKAYPTSTTTTSLKQNFQGQWVPVTETNYKTPNGDQTLRDPLWFLAKPVEAPSGKQGAGQPSPSNASKGSTKISTTQTTSHDGAPKQTTSNKRVQVGIPLFGAPNKEYNDLKAAYDSSVSRTKIMDKNLDNALKHRDQQAMLSLVANHIGMTLGAQKGARINQAVWNEAVESTPWLSKVKAKWGPDGYLSGVTLAPEQMRQMVELAHERTEIAKEDLDRVTNQLNQGVTNPIKTTDQSTSDPDVDAIIKALNGGNPQ